MLEFSPTSILFVLMKTFFHVFQNEPSVKYYKSWKKCSKFSNTIIFFFNVQTFPVFLKCKLILLFFFHFWLMSCHHLPVSVKDLDKILSSMVAINSRFFGGVGVGYIRSFFRQPPVFRFGLRGVKGELGFIVFQLFPFFSWAVGMETRDICAL